MEILMWMKENKFVCSTIFLLLVSGVFLFLYIAQVNAEEAYICPKTISSGENVQLENQDDIVIVDIKGAVTNPGVYRVSSKSIINDVIVLAGGTLENADTTNLNLSKVVTNEMMITVFTKDELREKKNLESIQEEKQDSVLESQTGLVSLNRATLEELMTLPGIGESKAKLILQYRENCGPFENVEELKNIKGIGESIYAKLEGYITI